MERTTFTVTRTNATQFRVETSIALSDHSFASSLMEIREGALRAVRGVRGELNFGYDFRVNLGPVSRAKIDALAIGETIVL